MAETSPSNSGGAGLALWEQAHSTQHPDDWYNLGQAQQACEQWSAAINSFHHVLALDPNHIEALNALGCVYQSQGESDKAQACFLSVLDQYSHHVGACNNLAVWHFNRREWQLGLEYLERAQPHAPEEQKIALAHNIQRAYEQWYQAVSQLGGLGKPWHILARWLAHRPWDPVLFDRYLTSLLADPEIFNQTYLNACHEWERRYAPALEPVQPKWPNTPEPERCLRVGYISPDFCYHSAADGYFPLFFYHNTSDFELYAYYNGPHEDQVTAQFRNHCTHWRNIVGGTDKAVCEQIRLDQVDILVETAGHTWGNRLLVLAHRAAPIQLSGLGFSSVTTGLSAVDGRLTHADLSPDNLAEKRLLVRHLHHWYLPGVQIEMPGPDEMPPFYWKGYITFGYMNNPLKLNDSLLYWWSQILQRVPRSRLWFKFYDFEHQALQQRCREIMGQAGIAPERLQFTGGTHTEGHIGHYRHLDIMLDPFPYNGGVTTINSLLQGVPVITSQEGHQWTALILKQVGLPQWIAKDPQAYCDLAVELALSPEQLRYWRKELPLHVMNSPAVDGLGFTRGLERVYRQVWREWCMTQRDALT